MKTHNKIKTDDMSKIKQMIVNSMDMSRERSHAWIKTVDL